MQNIQTYSLGPKGDVSIEALYQFCVKQNKPLAFTGLFDALPELTQWSSAKLRQLLGNRQVMVNVSESGLFNRSQMQAMPFQEYVDYLELPPEQKKDIRYMQQQSISGALANGCFPELSADLGSRWHEPRVPDGTIARVPDSTRPSTAFPQAASGSKASSVRPPISTSRERR
jgi:hypothetical protein